jgi:hypothetical protein
MQVLDPPFPHYPKPFVQYPDFIFSRFYKSATPVTVRRFLTVVWLRTVRYRRYCLCTLLARIYFLILSGRFTMLARKLTDADGTRRQSNLLKRNPHRPIHAKILSTVRSSRQREFSSTNFVAGIWATTAETFSVKRRGVCKF